MLKLKTKLSQGLGELKLDLSTQQQEQLLQFIELLQKWNAAFNLTAVRDPDQMVVRHLLDSLAIVPYLQGERCIDIGTGAGLPGLPLSIAKPEKNFFLLDSSQKKQIFVRQTIKTLGLTNAQAIHSQVQTYQATQKFSTILTRAFAPLDKMLALTSHLLAPQGRFLAMMGKVDQDALSVPEDYVVEAVIALKVPFETAQRHLAIIRTKDRQ